MKTTIAIIIVICASIFYTIIKPSFDETMNCFHSVDEKLANNTDNRQRLLISENTWCAQEAHIFQDVYSCIDQLEQESTITSTLYKVSPAKKQIEAFAAEHNEICPASIIERKQEKLYFK